MKTKILTIVAASLLMLSLAVDVQAATITSCTLDRDVYKQGETGHASLTIYNNMDDKIRVIELTVMIDYYYADGTVYLRTFFTNATLPAEILQGQSSTFIVPLSIPANIASGYARLFCRAKTDLWNSQAERWYASDNPTLEKVLYVESPYKERFEEQEAITQQLQNQVTQQQNAITGLEEDLHALQTSYNNTVLAMYILIAVTMALAATMAFLMRLVWKSRIQPASAPQ